MSPKVEPFQVTLNTNCEGCNTTERRTEVCKEKSSQIVKATRLRLSLADHFLRDNLNNSRCYRIAIMFLV